MIGKEESVEQGTLYILCVSTACMVHDLCNNMHPCMVVRL